MCLNEIILINVLESGCLVEEGSPEELLSRRGRFFATCQEQKF